MPRWHLVSVLGMALVAVLVYAPNPPKKFRAEFDPKVYPAAALATLRSEPSSHVFTNDEWGDYLIYSGRKVFVDGRSVGKTPLSVPDVAIGSHVVRIEMAGKQPWTTTTRVVAGEMQRVTGSLEDRQSPHE